MVILSKEKLNNLEKLLVKYPDIITNDEIKDSIAKTFTFKKPLTSIELYDKKIEKVIDFIGELEGFFFVDYVYFYPKPPEGIFLGLIFISRFKNLFDVAIYYANKHKGLLDKFADLSGILFGYPSKEVAKYCSKERLKKFNLLKY